MANDDDIKVEVDANEEPYFRKPTDKKFVMPGGHAPINHGHVWQNNIGPVNHNPGPPNYRLLAVLGLIVGVVLLVSYAIFSQPPTPNQSAQPRDSDRPYSEDRSFAAELNRQLSDDKPDFLGPDIREALGIDKQAQDVPEGSAYASDLSSDDPMAELIMLAEKYPQITDEDLAFLQEAYTNYPEHAKPAIDDLRRSMEAAERGENEANLDIAYQNWSMRWVHYFLDK